MKLLFYKKHVFINVLFIKCTGCLTTGEPNELQKIHNHEKEDILTFLQMVVDFLLLTWLLWQGLLQSFLLLI